MSPITPSPCSAFLNFECLLKRHPAASNARARHEMASRMEFPEWSWSVNPDTKPSPDPAISMMVHAFQEKLDGIYLSVRKNLLFDLGADIGKIVEVEPYPLGRWEITKERKKETGSAFFTLTAAKFQGVARVSWERYPNGQYVPQVIDDAEGFELWNPTPSIIPPDIEIVPGTYACLRGKYEGTIMTFTENEYMLHLVDEDGFIHFERKARYQLVGKILYIIDSMRRKRDRGTHSCGFTAWENRGEFIYKIKQHSETEFEIKAPISHRRFVRTPLVLGMKGLAYKTREQARGRIILPKSEKK